VIERNFQALLEKKWGDQRFVCVGLDSDYAQLPLSIQNPKNPAASILAFNQAIIDATHDLVCAYKPNIAFYEAYGDIGLQALQHTIAYIHQIAPDVPVILDAKRADIGNTNLGYVKEAFEYLKADAITVHPYLGEEALRPFLDQKNKGIIVLCRTSNPGGSEFQNLTINGEPLYQIVARNVATKWNIHGNCALVAGATHLEELRAIREIIGDEMPLLIPGIGAQGGDLEKTIAASKNSQNSGMIISASRSIIFASQGPDFAEAARRETQQLHQTILELNLSTVTKV
jgi:orotidine-5'-phosphate decarboxylase